MNTLMRLGLTIALPGCHHDGSGLSLETTGTGGGTTIASSTMVPQTMTGPPETVSGGSSTEGMMTEPTTGALTTEVTTSDSSGPGAACGDGQVDPGEDCDDGNLDNTDLCTNACKLASCGDGVVLPGAEECDDGNTIDTDICTNSCKDAECGDGIVGPGELCDDGNTIDDDSCSNLCGPVSCGDGEVQFGEECDDKNMIETDDCLSSCKSATCGDKFVQAGVEECDDGNKVWSDACTGTCEYAFCGDMIVHVGVEECDDGNKVDVDACNNSCVLAVAEYKTCKAILAAQPGAASGVYFIDPDGEGGETVLQTYCDMTTDGGGWTLMLNRIVSSDNSGQPLPNATWYEFNNERDTNWNFDVDLFWGDATQFVFAVKEGENCPNCTIAQYDSAIRVDKPAGPAYSKSCMPPLSPVAVKKLVGPGANMVGTAYQCGTSLGWGNCGGTVCHLGVHHGSIYSGDGEWGLNAWNEMHFPTSFSMYRVKQYEKCRSCGGGLAIGFNNCSSCAYCNGLEMFYDESRWTIWVR